jgi:hypothetical protein
LIGWIDLVALDAVGAAMIVQARREGARLKAACEVGGIEARTLQRWETNAGLQDGDGRPGAVWPVPAHELSTQERGRNDSGGD